MTNSRFLSRAAMVCAGLGTLVCAESAPSASATRPVAGALTPERLKLPSGPSSVRGLAAEPSIDPFRADVGYRVPIELPAGFGGLAPGLALSYSGALGNGPLGIGWTLELPRIQRSTRLGVPKYDVSDELELVGVAGGRLVAIGNGEYRVEGMGQTIRVRPVDGGFELDDGTGVRYRLGTSATSRVDRDAMRTTAWLVERQTNTMGEQISYEYLRDQGQVYPKLITWGPGGAYSAAFDYTTRNDATRSFRTGFSVVTAKRLTTITVRAFGVERRAYQLDYDESFQVARLQRVTSSGVRGEGAWPALTFHYAAPAPAQVTPIAGVGGWRLNTNGTVLVDLDGDGAADLLQMTSGGHSYRQNRDGTFSDPIPLTGTTQGISSLQLQDVDGDARAELLQNLSDGWQIWKFSPTGWMLQPGQWPGTSTFALKSDASARYADLDGDGLIDGIKWNSDGLLIARATRTGLQPLVAAPKIGGSVVPTPAGKFLDANGDGLDDYVLPTPSQLDVYLGHGDGLFEPVNHVAYPFGALASANDIELADLDRDGLLDLIKIEAGAVRWYHGRPGGSFSTEVNTVANPETLSTSVVVTVADTNGNGSHDLVWSSTSGMWRMDLAGATTAGMLVEIENGLGLDVTLRYQSAHSLSAAARAARRPWSSEVPIAMPVPVHKTTALGPGETPREISYLVRNGFWDPLEQRFGGFLTAIVTTAGATPAETASVTTIYNAGTGIDRELRGTAAQVLVQDGTGKVLSTAINTWTTMAIAGLPDTPLLRRAIQTRATVEYSDVSPSRITEIAYTYDPFGRATHVVDSGRTDDFTGDESVKDTTYADDDTTWIRDRVCEEKVSDSGGTVFSDVQYLFGDDQVQNAWCVVGRGWPRETRAWLDRENRWITRSQIGYDIHGNPTGIVDHGVERRIVYDPTTSLFPIEEHMTSPVVGDLAWGGSWDLTLGAIKTVTDPAGHTTTLSYDSLGRFTGSAIDGRFAHQVVVYDWNATFPKTTAWTFDGVLADVTALPTAWSPGQRWRQTVEVANGLGETRYRAVRLADAQWIVTGYQERDPSGRVVFAGRPVIASQLELAARPTDAINHQVMVGDTLTYDPLGRVLRETLPTGAARSYSYVAFERTTQEADLAPVHSVLDGQGRAILTERSLPDGTHEIVRASYDPTGRLTTMTLSGGIVTRRFEYDTLGRLRQSTDPDLGTRTLTWDDGDRLTSETNAAGQTIQYRYDSLGRLLTRDTGSVFTYHYDVARSGASGPLTNLRGQLAYVDEPTGGLDLGYDEFGRTSFTRRRIDAQTSESTSSFAASGLLLSHSFEDGFAITYAYDQAGRVIAAGDLWQILDPLTASGQPRHERTRNGVDTVYKYDELDLTKQVTVKDATGASIYNVLATRNAATEITSIADLDHVGLDHSATFTYDGFARLTDASIGSGAEAYTFGYRYDALHNMTSRTAIGPRTIGVFAGTYHYGEAGRALRQLTSITDTTGQVAHHFGYDAAGRQTSQDQQTMTYDASDRLLRVDGVSGGTVAHAYGHDGARIKTTAPDGAVSYYFGDGSAMRNGVREHDVEVGRRVVARTSASAATATGAASFGAILGAVVNFGVRALGLALLAVALVFGRRRARRRALAAATVGLTLAASCAAPGGGSFRNRLSADATTMFLHTGFAAGPTVFTDSNGRMLEERRYEPFGMPIDATNHSAAGDVVGAPDVVARDLNELNKRTDATTGWSDHGARWMAPETGRWLMTDPPVAAPDPRFMAEPWSLHPYQYVNQNPVQYWDPDGRYAEASEQVIENMLRVAAVGGGVAAEAATIPGVGWAAAGLVAVGTAFIVGTIALSAGGGAASGGGFMGCDGPASCRTVMMAEHHAQVASKEQVAQAFKEGVDAKAERNRSDSRFRFALGIMPYVIDFASRHNAQTFMYDPAGAWRTNFLNRLNDSRSEFYVNLKGLGARGGPDAAVARAASGGGGATDWELLQLVDHASEEAEAGRDFWQRVKFFDDTGHETSNPFR